MSPTLFTDRWRPYALWGVALLWLIASIQTGVTVTQRTSYSPDGWKTGAHYWKGRESVTVYSFSPRIPKQLPGPLDVWGGGNKEIRIQSSFVGPARITIHFADSHESAPPTLAISVGESKETYQVTAGSGRIADKVAPPIEPLVREYPNGLDTPFVIRSIAGSWVEFSEILIEPLISPWKAPTLIIGWLLIVWAFRKGRRDRIEPSRMRPLAAPLNLALLTFSLFLPGGRIFDGAPLAGDVEFYTTALLLPFLFITRFDFLRRRWLFLVLVALACMKLTLVYTSPAAGLSYYLYDTPEAMNDDRWERTYDSLWQGEASERRIAPYESARQFPLEWLNRPHEGARTGLGWIGVKVKGIVTIPEDTALVALATGVSEGALTLSIGEKTYTIPLIHDPSDAFTMAAQLLDRTPTGAPMKLNGQLIYARPPDDGEGMSFHLLLTDRDGLVTSAHREDVLRENGGEKANPLTLWGGRFSDAALLLFFLLWIVFGGSNRETENRRIFEWAGFLAAALVALLHLWGMNDPGVAAALHLISPPYRTDAGGANWTLIGIVTPLLLLTLGWLTRASDDIRGVGRNTLTAIAPATLLHCALLWRGEMGLMRLLDPGHDWHTYQDFARHIFVQGDWLSLHEGIYRYMPFYRYVVGGLHTLFGQSMMAGGVWDLWALLLSCAALAGIMTRIGLSHQSALAGVALYSFHALNGGFFWLLDKGLQEMTSVGLMMFALWLIVDSPTVLTGRRALVAGLVAALAMATRIDHIGPLAAMILFSLTPQSATGIVGAWRNLVVAAWEKKKSLFIYWGALALAPLAIGTRNWLVGGIFCLDDPRDLSAIECPDSPIGCAASNLSVIVAAADPGAIGFAAPLISIGSTLALLALVTRIGPLRAIPLALGLSVAAVFSPYLLYTPFGYAPRFSAHLLPFAVMAVVMAGYAVTFGRCTGTPPDGGRPLS